MTLELEPPKERVTEGELKQFRGCPCFYSLTPNQFPLQVLVTEGVHYLIEKTHCSWLIAEIVRLFIRGDNQRIQHYRRKLRGLFFVVKFKANNQADLICYYDEGDELERVHIPSTDLGTWVAMPELKLWVFPNRFPDKGTTVFWTFMLPSEY